MVYCTIDHIRGAMAEYDLIRFTDDADTGEPDLGKIAQAVEGASDLIDSHISSRYGAGLDPVPGLVRDLAVDISVYKICTRKSDAPEEWRARYEDALALLKSIAAGKADIPGVTITDDTGATDGAAAVVAPAAGWTNNGNGLVGF